ncbi:type II secretion system F family protein [Vibrio hannami]|uniref:type II secretion system F family protein n=1 Tax=Vibrio hannami TaxID=2717094 RepID=UPI00240F03F3|nr:type II secretion system F family protein [Vibrio hannami]MDG3085989.1 type II secretion system F family protein [Vibrio hannami]
MIYIALICFGVALIVFGLLTRKPTHGYFKEYNRTVKVYSMADIDSAVDFESLSGLTYRQRFKRYLENLRKQLGSFALIKLVLFYILVLFVGYEVNDGFFKGNILFVEIFFLFFGSVIGMLWLQRREEKEFEAAFPDALNILASAVSSGESIMHAIIYVGKTLDGSVGAEFKSMGDRLQMGEHPDEVFSKAAQRFPYPSFQFFVITLRANMQRGGQLKEVMNKLNRVMANAKAIEKKKYALTAEARTSAKIVGALPFIFLLLLQYIAPENYEFVMFDPDGRPILYYLLISEAVGLSIVWGLMRGVR